MEIGLESPRPIETAENSQGGEEVELIPSGQLLQQKLKEPEFQREFNRIAVIGEIKRALIEARKRENLTQEEVAKRMGTTKSVISRMESLSNDYLPTLKSLIRYGEALGKKLKIEFE
jgi:DNA-binding XRE family transcriptional regulator